MGSHDAAGGDSALHMAYGSIIKKTQPSHASHRTRTALGLSTMNHLAAFSARANQALAVACLMGAAPSPKA
jgi:hypothetical protein